MMLSAVVVALADFLFRCFGKSIHDLRLLLIGGFVTFADKNRLSLAV